MHHTKGKIGFTAGNFDLLHPGYIYTFETAKENCDYFMVFLQRDPSETRFTKYKPVIPLYERYKTLMALEHVDEVITYQTEEDLLTLMEFYKPDVRILGDDYIGKRFTGDHLDIEIIYTTRSHGWSTTKLKDLITMQTVKQNPELIDRAKNDVDTTAAQHLMLAIRDEIAQYVEGNLTEEQYKNGIKELLEDA
jgi:cytidyltransferase-like protein|tara:strand:- start:1207 stop:1785 length:579 start_codon:yes stop_codon:yes gene_type:complete